MLEPSRRTCDAGRRARHLWSRAAASWRLAACFCMQAWPPRIHTLSRVGLWPLQVFCTDRFSFLATISRYTRLDRPVSVLDAGAGTGIQSVLFAALTLFAGDVIAVEPYWPRVDQMTTAADGLVKHVVQAVRGVLNGADEAVEMPREKRAPGAHGGASGGDQVSAIARSREQAHASSRRHLLAAGAPPMRIYRLEVCAAVRAQLSKVEHGSER